MISQTTNTHCLIDKTI